MNRYFIIALMLLLALMLNAQLPELPITEYDYHQPQNAISPVAIGMGGINITNANDFYASYDNPALLASNLRSTLALSYRLVNSEQMNFLQMMQFSNALNDKQVKYFTLTTKGGAVSYQPVSSIHISQWDASGINSQYYDYQLDKWQLSLGVKDPDRQLLSGGMSLKYLTGRLVYLKERRSGNSFIREAFIDDKVKGFSADLGFTIDQGDFIWAAAFYDLFSKLYWENYDAKSLQRRSAIGFEYHKGDLSLLAGTQYKIDKEPEPTFHFGMVQNWNWQSGSTSREAANDQSLILRLGMYSKDFYGTGNINYTLGSGYYYNMFRFDFALTNQGMKLKDSEYLFSIGVGLQ